MMPHLVECKQNRNDCIMCLPNGKCSALSNTEFQNRKCPFYKKNVKQQNK